MTMFEQRILIPAAVAFMAFLLTLWTIAGFDNARFAQLVQSPSSVAATRPSVLPLEWIGFVGIAFVMNYAVGYLSKALFVAIQFRFRWVRFVDFDLVLRAFGYLVDGPSKDHISRAIEPSILAEVHLRLHTHAPPSLRDHCTKRNNAWYIAVTSGIVVLVAPVVATVYAKAAHGALPEGALGWCVFLACGLIPVAIALIWQGNRWNREFWEVVCSFIHGDRITHPLPAEFLDYLRERAGIGQPSALRPYTQG